MHLYMTKTVRKEYIYLLGITLGECTQSDLIILDTAVVSIPSSKRRIKILSSLFRPPLLLERAFWHT